MAEILTERFLLRPLTIDDATPRYLSWFAGDGAANIVSAASVRGLDDLRDYIAARSDRDDVWFLGIFDRASGLHIGNLKYEPVDRTLGYAILGIFVGDRASRGKGVAEEVVQATARWLKQHRDIARIVLGVLKTNAPAIRAYEKIGFVVADSPHYPHATDEIVSMVWEI